MQTKRSSFLESCVNVLIGYIVAIASQLMIFPWFGINIPFHDNLLIGVYFTIISLIRSYVIRRWFNKKVLKQFIEKHDEIVRCHD